jgi:type II pantothenate kinase
MQMTGEWFAGIDAGGTLIKIAAEGADRRILRCFPAADAPQCVRWIKTHLPDARLCFTGGSAIRLKDRLGQVRSPVVPEFEASARGVRDLLRSHHTPVPDRFILTNCGTGTSIHRVTPEGQTRLGGSGVGGGTLLGLAQLMTGESDFETLMKLATQGRRDQADLTVAHIYEGTRPPIPGDLTASNFGRVPENSRRISDGDKVAAVIGMVAETITSLTLFAAEKEALRTAVFIGSIFVDNPVMKNTVRRYCGLCSLESIIPENGRFSGAVGACLMLREKSSF